MSDIQIKLLNQLIILLLKLYFMVLLIILLFYSFKDLASNINFYQNNWNLY